MLYTEIIRCKSQYLPMASKSKNVEPNLSTLLSWESPQIALRKGLLLMGTFQDPKPPKDTVSIIDGESSDRLENLIAGFRSRGCLIWMNTLEKVPRHHNGAIDNGCCLENESSQDILSPTMPSQNCNGTMPLQPIEPPSKDYNTRTGSSSCTRFQDTRQRRRSILEGCKVSSRAPKL